MANAICLGDILHISLGNSVKCFGLSKTYSGTRSCHQNLGQKRLSDARYILIQTLAQLERGNQTLEEHLINLSELLVHSRVHREAGEARKRDLQSKWKDLVEEYRTAQTQLIVRSEYGTNQAVLALHDSTLSTPSTPISTPTPAALTLTPPIIHTDHWTNDTIPDPTPDPDLHIHTTSVGQEDNRRGPQGLRPMPELPCDRTSSNPACLSVGRQSLSAGDVSFEYIWILLVQICFGRQSQQGLQGLCSWMNMQSLQLNKIFSTDGLLKDYAVELRFLLAARFSLMELARSLIWGISFYYGVLVLVPGLLHVILSNYLFISTLFIVFVAGWGSGQSVRYPVTVRPGYEE